MTNHLFDHLFAPHAGNASCFLMLDEPGTVETEISYAAFLDRAARLANVLTSRGLRPGDRVVVQAPKRSEMLALYAATIQAGGVFLPLNTAYTLDELTYFVEDAAPRIIVCGPEVAVLLAPLAGRVGGQILTLDTEGSGTLAAAMAGAPATFATCPRGPDDLAALLYTSGTTGRSKGAMMSHDNLLSNARALTDLWQITAGDRLIHALPIFHTHGLFVAINTALLAGARVDFMPRFDLDTILAALPGSTLMMGVPTFYTRLLADPRLTRDLVSGLRLFISGSAPLLAETHGAFAARTGHHILERYGMTETNMIASNPYDGPRIAGTVGQPLAGVEVRVCYADGEALPAGETGMIEVRGPNVFQGYWNMPGKTAEDLRGTGFFITGDLGRFDQDGYLSIVGRQKDLIITGGYNVYPKEIEDVLNMAEGVAESAVFGVADADFGERILAAIVPDHAASVDLDALRDIAEQKLARFKHPRAYHILDTLPRNAMGKVQKTILRDRFAGS